MKILIIPSWYPYPANPLAGRFFVDQALALAKHSSHDYYLLNFGQNEYQLSLRKPLQSLRHLKSYLKAEASTVFRHERLQEIKLPLLSWTARIQRGNLDAYDMARLPKVDLVYAQVSFPGAYLAARVAKAQGIQYVVAEHSGPFPLAEFTKAGSVSPLVANTLKGAKSVIAVSSSLQEQILVSTGVQAMVIPNMVDCEYFVPLEKDKAKLQLFSMTPFTHAKGAEDLADAMLILDKSGLDYQMHWAGEGALKRALMQKCLPLAHKIRFTDYLSREQALAAYQACDVYLMPSRIESFSMVLIEAMSCGKPVVATACGGPRDIVKAGLGVLVEPQNPQAMASAIISMIENLSTYDPLIIRRHCLASYSEAVVCKMLNKAFS
jgi:glycosyltransferase involved in cell wall biosynthesis